MRKSMLLFGFLFILAGSLSLVAQLDPEYSYMAQKQFSLQQERTIHSLLQLRDDKDPLTDLPLEAKISMACLAAGVATFFTSFVIYNRAYWDAFCL